MTLLDAVNLLALLTGVAYAILAARRSPLCWIAGAVSAACAAFLSALVKLPMQAGLQVFYVGMAAYGWWSWKRGTAEGEVVVGVWPLGRHLAAALLLVGLSLASARWLRPGNFADWPLLDSLTTWFSLFATWLTARAKLESWLYWIAIDAAMVFLFYAQGTRARGLALLSLFLVFIAGGGFLAWLRRYRIQQVVPA